MRPVGMLGSLKSRPQCPSLYHRSSGREREREKWRKAGERGLLISVHLRGFSRKPSKIQIPSEASNDFAQHARGLLTQLVCTTSSLGRERFSDMDRRRCPDRCAHRHHNKRRSSVGHKLRAEHSHSRGKQQSTDHIHVATALGDTNGLDVDRTNKPSAPH